MATLVDLLENVGADKIDYQMLDSSFIGAKKTRHGDVEITFATNRATPYELLNRCGNVGVIIWVDRDIWYQSVTRCTIPTK